MRPTLVPKLKLISQELRESHDWRTIRTDAKGEEALEMRSDDPKVRVSIKSHAAEFQFDSVQDVTMAREALETIVHGLERILKDVTGLRKFGIKFQHIFRFR